MKRATDRQVAILRFIIAQVEEKGYAPTLREIMAVFDIRSPQGAKVHLDALQRKGFLAQHGDTRTNYSVVRNPEGQRVAIRFVPIDV